MRILLINPSGWQKESINLGLAYLSSALKAAGHSTLILDLNRNEMTDWTLLNKAKDYSPSIIGISVKTATANEGGRLANILSSTFNDAIFVVGGPHITLCAESYMEAFPVFNYAVMGEGEQSIVELVNGIAEDRTFNAISGLVYRKEGNITANRFSPPENLNDLLMPDLDAIERFDWSGFRYPIVTSRGCPFDCIYCCVNKLTDSRRWRARSVNNVVDELEYVVRMKGIKTFEIWDDNFTLNIKRAKEICRALIERKLNLSWYCHNGIRADRIDQELASLMKKAGCTSIAFGIESGNPETFDSIKKGEPLSAVVNAVKIVKKAGIKAVGYFIIGLPGDTIKKFIETVRFQRSLKLDSFIFGMLIPYPKTAVWDIVQSRGKIFCDITYTQHFSSDIVPVSFELPEFPRQDMIRAFYIAKFFPLYEAVQQIVDEGKVPVVAYMTNSQMKKTLAGMIIACHHNVQHIILGHTEKNEIHKLPSFSQVPEGISLAFHRTMPCDISKDRLIIVSHSDNISKSIFSGNTRILLVEPAIPLTVLVRKYVKLPVTFPDTVLSILGLFSAFPEILSEFGRDKAFEMILTLIKKRHVVLINRIAPYVISSNIGNRSLIIKVLYRFYEILQLVLLMPWQIYQYSRTKKKLKMIKSKRKSNYPYDDYSSYM